MWEFDLRVFACEKLGFSRTYSTGQLKACLSPVMGELEAVGYIEPVEYCKERPKQWKIAISQKSTDLSAEITSVTPFDRESLVALLIERGITANTSHNLVRSYPLDRIHAQLDLFDWLTRRGDRRISKNPPGWLATAIRKDYPPPRDYLRATGRLKPSATPLKSPVGELPGIKPVDPIAEPIAPVQQVIDEYLFSLSEVERMKLEGAALERAGSVLARGYERSKAAGGQAFAAYRRMLLEREARRIQESLAKTTKKTAPEDSGNG